MCVSQQQIASETASSLALVKIIRYCERQADKEFGNEKRGSLLKADQKFSVASLESAFSVRTVK